MFKDREYLSGLVKIALPIAFQNLISSSLNMLGVLMVGQLGQTAVAAVGLANQIFFLFNLTLFGLSSGTAIFTAQFWGCRDLHNIRKVTGMCLGASLLIGTFFSVVALVFPTAAMSIYTQDPEVIRLGTQYLLVVGVSYMATSISYTYQIQLRSTGKVMVPTLVSMASLSLGMGINYVLIFGALGFPALGAVGAAWGTCIARILECLAMVLVTYLWRMPTAFTLADLKDIDLQFFKRFWVTVLPVAANEAIWSLGVSIYNVVYARISTEAIAAVNITTTIESMTFVVFIGVANAAAVIIGNRIGAGEEHKAMLYARRTLLLGIALGVLVGGLLVAFSSVIVGNYKISPASAEYARNILIIQGCVLWIRASNMNLIVGILRSGGDTRYSLILDVGTVWFVGIPMALIGAFWLRLPVYWVVLMVYSDELCKFIGGLLRFLSRRWINNLVSDMS